MKKVKIMLMSVLVLAIVGGALAFKAKKENQCVFLNPDISDPSSAKICTLVTSTLESPTGPQQFRYKKTSEIPDFVCTTELTTTPCVLNALTRTIVAE